MPDLGIGEAIAALGGLLGGGAGGLGAAAGGAAGAAELGADAGLAAGGAGLADALGGGADLGAADLGLGAGGAAGPTAASLGTAVGPAASPLGGGLGGLAGPAGLSGGIVPAGAPPIDLASAAAPQGDVTALFTGTTANPNAAFDASFASPPTSGSGIWSDTAVDFAQGGGPESALTSSGTSPELATLTAGASNPAAVAPGAGLTTAGAGASVPGTAAGAAPAGTSGTFLDNLLGGATNAITKNPLGIGLAAGGLGYNILEGRKLSTNEQALQAAAGTQAGAGQQLQNYINTGQLPPGMAAQVANAKAAAKASIISGYAARGQNADPSQNSALAQELSQVDMNSLALEGQLATELLNSGITETGMSNNLYAQLIQMDQGQAKLTGQAIANFAAALAGGPKTIQIGNQGVTA